MLKPRSLGVRVLVSSPILNKTAKVAARLVRIKPDLLVLCSLAACSLPQAFRPAFRQEHEGSVARAMRFGSMPLFDALRLTQAALILAQDLRQGAEPFDIDSFGAVGRFYSRRNQPVLDIGCEPLET